MNAGPQPMSWRQAASRASFEPYRPVSPSPDHVYLGGFGLSGETATHLGISAVLGDGEIEVDTDSDQRRMSPASQRCALIRAALFHHVHEHEHDLTLPLDLRVEPDDRRITVDGTERVFHGLRVAGGRRWSGSCDVDDLRITVSTTGSAIVEAIASAGTDDLTDTPPRRHRQPDE